MPDYRVHDRYQAHLSRSPSPNQDPDAGLKGLGHYERRLPEWRFKLRQVLIPIVRGETPYLASIQARCRSPLLDSYFALTANLGTHTFFMTALPICFWCGYPEMGVSLVHMLAMGVYLSGYMKDMVCLPRPLSPPLQRITMSGSAAMEYGFPSTHTTNAVSVAMYCLHQLYAARDDYSDLGFIALAVGCYCYAISISLGRMYCGMHGFSDIVIGGILGAFIAGVRIAYGAAVDHWILSGDWTRSAVIVLALAVAVRIHPEPADNCPCYDDSVAFIGVVMGVSIGTWQLAQYASVDAASGLSLPDLYPQDNQDLLKSIARIVGGVVVVFVWRATMKPLLLRFLPPIFRVVESYGLSIPRRYFLQPRQYQTVPTLRRDDNLIPPASEIPTFMSNFGSRKRTVSIGPQSEADAREFIANREQMRRNSRSEAGSTAPRPSRDNTSKALLPTPEPIDEDAENASQRAGGTSSYLDVRPARPSNSHLRVVGPDPNLLTPPPSDGGASDDGEEMRNDRRNDRAMFSLLEKPRIRYDVEVITKLVVYAGIAWWAVIGNLLWFKMVGIA